MTQIPISRGRDYLLEKQAREAWAAQLVRYAGSKPIADYVCDPELSEKMRICRNCGGVNPNCALYLFRAERAAKPVN